VLSELGKLGGGASCEVFSGHLYGLFVAVKRLGDSADAWEGEQFQSELELLCKARHASLCRLFSYSVEPRLCLVLELCSGGALDKRLACAAGQVHPPLTWEHRLRIAVDIGNGLAYLHSMTPQMLHRDVKSANILLDDAGNAKVAGALRLAGCMPALLTTGTTSALLTNVACVAVVGVFRFWHRSHRRRQTHVAHPFVHQEGRRDSLVSRIACQPRRIHR
jgi:serine/threonine protein kinase